MIGQISAMFERRPWEVPARNVQRRPRWTSALREGERPIGCGCYLNSSHVKGPKPGTHIWAVYVNLLASSGFIPAYWWRQKRAWGDLEPIPSQFADPGFAQHELPQIIAEQPLCRGVT